MDPCTGTANPPCVDGCVWSLEMWCSVLSGAIVAVTALASLSLMGSYTAPGQYPPSGAPIHHLGLCPWGPQWRGSSVVINCDNMGAVAVINTGSTKVPHIMYLLRCLFFIRARFTLSVRAVHVLGVENSWVDAISHSMLSDFLSQVPGAISRHQPMPPSLLGLLVGQLPDWTSTAWTQLFKRFPSV